MVGGFLQLRLIQLEDMWWKSWNILTVGSEIVALTVSQKRVELTFSEATKIMGIIYSHITVKIMLQNS